jgi:hypothetical protein
MHEWINKWKDEWINKNTSSGWCARREAAFAEFSQP